MYALHNNIPLQFRSNNGYIVTYGKLYGLLCGDTQIQNLMHFGTQFCQIALSGLLDRKTGNVLAQLTTFFFEKGKFY